MIGDLEICYCEDFVCMLCVVRFVIKLGMSIVFVIEKFIKGFVNLLDYILLVCLFEELFKLFLNGKVEENYLMFC